MIAAIVENAGFGAAHAAPIARRVFDYWINHTYPSPEDIAATQLGQTAAPTGKSRPASEFDILRPNAPTPAASAASAPATASAPVNANAPRGR